MKKFLKYILAILVLLFIINVCLDYGISCKLQHSPDRRYQSWSKIIYEQLNSDLVIMGSSRAWVQYSPMILDSILRINSYNLGIDGSGLNRQIVKYDVYNHFQQQKPQCIILNIDYFSASEWSYGYEREQFFPFMWNPYLRKEIMRVEPFSIGEKYIPIYRYVTYKGLYSVIRENPWDAKIYKGYLGHDRTWNAKAYEELTVYHFNMDKRVIDLFDRFLEDRKAEGIQVVFCFAPIYVGLTNKVENLQEFFDFYKSISEEYDIPILDYTYSKLSMDTTFFYNASHLNRKGAELFSIQLAHDLNSLGITK